MWTRTTSSDLHPGGMARRTNFNTDHATKARPCAALSDRSCRQHHAAVMQRLDLQDDLLHQARRVATIASRRMRRSFLPRAPFFLLFLNMVLHSDVVTAFVWCWKQWQVLSSCSHTAPKLLLNYSDDSFVPWQWAVTLEDPRVGRPGRNSPADRCVVLLSCLCR